MKQEQNDFKLVTDYQPAGDQPQAILELYNGLKENKKHQVLLGATGTGKTFTIANIIQKFQKQTLVLAHNKTLAMQLYIELKEFFPENRVEYFVSNFDFFQPEAYMPARDLYIDKDAKINQELDMMRLSAMNGLMLRKDTIVVASVASIYAAQNPEEYGAVFFELRVGETLSKKELLSFLIKTGYVRNEIETVRGTFSANGDVIKIVPSWTDQLIFRISLFGNEIESIETLEPYNNKIIQRMTLATIFPATSYVTAEDKMKTVIENIKAELKDRLKELREDGKMLEAQRLEQRTNYDLESLSEFGTVSGVENYSAHLDFRAPGVPPYTLLDYFEKDFLTVIDESHMMIPQVRGMSNTDKSRKKNLVDYGFRLPSAMDNRPLNFEEFSNKLNQVIYTSATPGDYEMELTEGKFVQQIIRPTGLLDPIIEVRSTENQIENIIEEILKRREKNERVFITTLTIRMSEDLTSYLQERNIKVAYLHSELKTIERTTVLNDLRKGVYEAIVGVNLLREGLDIPEVSLVCILDADKQGFLRNTRSLIQTTGRAARNASGLVIFYADQISKAMQETIDETDRRREIQARYNLENNIVPKTILKKISDFGIDDATRKQIISMTTKKNSAKNQKNSLVEKLRADMVAAAKELNFEKAAQIRDIIIELEG
ncbi:excinuclease ABC subunit B [Spiroplasma sabaudiense Ar-1343]|uniref:UvrABC system protein B n=1 Tax=Spiroplasma sabaudiense Ar-1343 TaxID=1276257 RepID=W6A8Y0_9MOLU|nr:excinuclease ABC subunit UvrB [Spiroplasma sabaudiense]AHI53472.1 excinuclease ABC subunit B [Spiroplasma sabaudiense Ar-1343]